MTTVANLKATRREWIGLSILILPTLIVSMDMTVTYLALPVLSAALHPTSAELLWMTDIFGFFEAGLLIVMGSLGDRIGVKKLLLSGASAFTAASVLAAFAPSAFWLIVARAVMGIAGATLLPTVLSLIRNMFHDERQRTFAMGLYTTCFSSGTMLGPIIGGFLLSHFWWGSIFLMPVPLILIMLFTAPTLLPEFKDHHHAKSLDLFSSALLISATLLAIFGVKQLAQNGWGVLPLVCILGGLGIVLLFLRRQKTVPDPLIDLSLFGQHGFSTALMALLTALFAWSGIFLFVGQYLQSVLGVSSFSAGLWMLPGALGSVILCMAAPVIVRYVSRGVAIAAGLAVLATGILLLLWLTANSLTLLVAAMFLISGGCGVTVTLGIDMVVASAPANKAGAAAGISETSTGIGAGLGVALLGCLWTAFYRGTISKNMLPGLSERDADAVRNTIGGAVAEAGKLRQPALADMARQAFVHSLHITALVAAFVVFIVAVLIAFKFNRKVVPV